MLITNLQAGPVWKRLLWVLSRIICVFLKQAREHDGTGAPLQVLPKSSVLCTLHHHHVHRTSFTILIHSLRDVSDTCLVHARTQPCTGLLG